MTPETQQRLLDLNRAFYASVADPFDDTRQGLPAGMLRSLEFLPTVTPLRVLDAGCGNGRYAWAIETLGRSVEYTGVDADERLLALAQTRAARLNHVQNRFIRGDLASPDWVVAGLSAPYDAVICLATLHHFPGFALRRRILRDLAGLLTSHGRLIVATWQFLASPRLAMRRMSWDNVGLQDADVEPGDALLPWKQGVFAVRYVHQIDAAEMRSLACDVGLTIVASYTADGREGNLNLYTILETQRSGTSREQREKP